MYRPKDSCAPHLMIVIWVHSKSADAWLHSLNYLYGMYAIPLGFSPVLQDLASHPGLPDKISGAIIRDLKDEDLVDFRLLFVVSMTSLLRSNGPLCITLETPSDRQILWGLLSACFRQLCLGNSTDSDSGLLHDELLALTLNLFQYV